MSLPFLLAPAAAPAQAAPAIGVAAPSGDPAAFLHALLAALDTSAALDASTEATPAGITAGEPEAGEGEAGEELARATADVDGDGAVAEQVLVALLAPATPAHAAIAAALLRGASEATAAAGAEVTVAAPNGSDATAKVPADAAQDVTAPGATAQGPAVPEEVHLLADAEAGTEVAVPTSTELGSETPEAGAPVPTADEPDAASPAPDALAARSTVASAAGAALPPAGRAGEPAGESPVVAQAPRPAAATPAVTSEDGLPSAAPTADEPATAAPTDRPQRPVALAAPAASSFSATVDGASGVADGPVAVPGQPGAAPSALLDRVMEAVELLEHRPPPRRMVVEVGDMRLTVSLRGDEVRLSVAGGRAGGELPPEWEGELSGALSARGFSLGGGGRQGSSENPARDPRDPHDLPERPVTPSPSARRRPVPTQSSGWRL